MKTFKTLLYFFLPIFVSCEKYESPKENYQKSNGVFIVCEGNYSYSTSTLSFFDPANSSVENDIFEKTNGIPMGDVAQSMIVIDSIGYIVINNSQKIIVVNTNTFKQITTISGFTSPRYIQLINNEKAYVTDLYSNDIRIINPKTYKIIGTINVNKTTEQLVKNDNYVFVTNWSGEHTIQRINCVTDLTDGELEVTRQPNSIVLDKNNKLWVLSDGGFQGDKDKQIPTLTKIDVNSFSIEKVLNFPSIEYSPSRLTINATKDTIYFLSGGWEKSTVTNNGVYKMSVSENAIPVQPFINQKNKLFYALGIDPKSNQIYVSDALDYKQSGVIYHFTANAMPIDTFKAGVIPAYFCFK